MTLLEASHLVKSYLGRRQGALGRPGPPVHAVDDVTFSLDTGRTLALVGESGAGKSTAGRLVLRLIEPDRGRVTFQGRDITALPRAEMRKVRRSMQMIFQDPYGCLEPRMTVTDNTAEPLLVHFGTSRGERRRAALDLLERVGLSAELADRYPDELSGGQLQRASIARALTLQPALIVCDEPTAALDVSVQAQVINLMVDLQRELGLAYLFISHDLALVRTLADEIAVMKDGRVVEHGSTEQVFERPEHPYTQELLAAIPDPMGAGHE